MVSQSLVRQAYRIYGAGLIVWAAWSLTWIVMRVNLDPAIVGAGWVGLGVVGAVLALTLFRHREANEPRLFTPEPDYVEQFDQTIFSSTPLHAYAIGLVGLSVVSEAWALGVRTIDPTFLAFGWYLVALYGLVLTLGLAARHKEAIRASVGLSSATTDLQ